MNFQLALELVVIALVCGTGIVFIFIGREGDNCFFNAVLIVRYAEFDRISGRTNIKFPVCAPLVKKGLFVLT